MRRHAALAASVLLVVFGVLVLAVQLLVYNYQPSGPQAVVHTFDAGSIVGSFLKGNILARIPGIVERGGGTARLLDLTLPANARLYVTGVIGTNSGSALAQYYYMSYYLFPREVAISLDQPRFTAEGFQGRGPASDEDLKAADFDTRVDLLPGGTMNVARWQGGDKDLANPEWFGSWSDALRAGLLPLLTALSGVWLLRLLFGGLAGRMAIGEQLACGLGLGMMAVAALTLGVKLAGCPGHGWLLALTAVGGICALRRDGPVFWKEITGGIRKVAAQPVTALLLAAGAVVFLILFRLAALQGIAEFDGVANWLFKAKILFFCTGHELVGWFSNPRLAYAHLDYPTLVPSLHAATFDSLGHVDEFVTKFWPAWMLLFLLLALSSLSRGGLGRFPAPLFFLLGVLLLPITQDYVQMEGATLPMVFFTVLGLVECALGLAEQSRARLGLGLMLLFGAALTKFEGAIFLALAAGWLLLVPKARPLLKPSPGCWRILAFGFLAALPFLCMRAQIPVLHFESGWARYALAHPGVTVSEAPKIFLILVARLFLAPNVARWSAGGGQLHWIGQWDGGSSFYDHFTLGLPWLSLLLTVLLWVAKPARRPAILWTLAVFFSALMAISVVFASFVSVSGLNDVVSARASDNEAGRYLFPLLLAWASVMVILFFRDFPSPTFAPEGQPVPANPLDGVAPTATAPPEDSGRLSTVESKLAA